VSISILKADQLKLSNEAVNSFFRYISSDRKQVDKFLVTKDGSSTFTWACPQTLCFPASKIFYTKPCSKLKNKACIIFASGRKVKLTNRKKSAEHLRSFKQNETLEEVRSKLKALGFVN